MHRPDRHWQDALGPRQADDGHARPVRPRQGGLLCADVCQPDAGPARREARQAAQGHLRPAVRQEVRHHGRRPQYARAADVRRPATGRAAAPMDGPRRLVRPQGVLDAHARRHPVHLRDGPARRRPQPGDAALPAPLQHHVDDRLLRQVARDDLRHRLQLLLWLVPRRDQVALQHRRPVDHPHLQHHLARAAADALQVALHVQPARPLKGLPGHDAGHAQVGRRAKGPDLPLVPRDAAGFL
mmetsp:Transcript_69177/g.207485  ORF Transcript_69177/g.207485 Transcript_69177/m.207485 type:complete len:241 (+) Transcript_69177:284-1006(+)